MTNANDTASQGLRYTERGWAVVQLHDVAGGLCSCGSADPEHAASQGGKHPVGKGWQNAGLRTAAAVADAWARRPGANIGIVTGRASGIWVLDVDPLHGGDKQLAALVAAYGPLPETYTVRTGSGGRHYYWLMPDFDFTTSRGQLPLGLDVRGNAGQVVAPPSYTLRGSYVVLVDVPVVAAPAWLLGLIRPVERPEPVDRGPAGEAWTMPSAAAGRGAGYAAVAVREVLGQLAGAQPGERNVTAYRVGRRLAELIASPWAGLDADAVWLAYLDAAARCDVDGGFSQSEAAVVLTRAVRDQGRRGVDLPAPDHLGTRTDWAAPPSDFDRAGQDPANPFSSPGARLASIDVAGQLINGPAEQGEDVDPLRRARYIESQADRIRCDRAARRIVDDEERSPIDWSAEILNEDQLDELPEVRPLIEGVLDSDAFFRIVGKSGSRKSFVAIDMAVCVSAGISWHGRAVQRGPVLYVLGEGAAGIKKRLQGAREHYGLTRHGVRIVRRPVQFSGVEWDSFVAHLSGLPEEDRPALIFLDTQAQMSTGLDENFAKDQSVIVGACRALRTATGACVVLIHHVGLGDSKRGRGITTIFDALDNEILVTSKGMIVELEFMKTKEEERAEPLTLNAKRVDVGPPVLVSHPGTPLRSVNQPTTLVLVGGGDMDSMPKPNTRELSSARRLMLITVLREHFGVGSGGTKAEVRGPFLDLPEIKELSRDAARKAFDSAWSHLEHLGRLARNPGRDRFRFAEFDDLFDLEENVERVAPEGWDGWTIPDVAPEGRPIKAGSE